MDYEVVVIGGGLAGLTAGLYSSRFGLRTLIIEQMAPGGQVVNIERIETFPGFPDGIGGATLGPMVQAQAEQAGAEFAFDTAKGIERDAAKGFTIRCSADDRRADAIIIAVGSLRRGLGVPGEAELRGHGVSECAACDGPFFVGKRVVVVGGGDSALDEACVLADQGVEHILLVHRGSSFEGQLRLIERVRSKPTIEPMFDTEIVEIRGDGVVSDVVLRHAGTLRTQAADAVFPYVGLQPNTDWLKGTVNLDSAGHVVTDASLMTSLAGVFAAGDIRQHSAAQLVASAGDGASAAVAAMRYLTGGHKR
jgi:thioredoxin reductase (NADPH)